RGIRALAPEERSRRIQERAVDRRPAGAGGVRRSGRGRLRQSPTAARRNVDRIPELREIPARAGVLSLHVGREPDRAWTLRGRAGPGEASARRPGGVRARPALLLSDTSLAVRAA